VQFQGYIRDNGDVGVRNYLAVLPSVYCANRVAEEIAARIGEPAVALPHTVGCGQLGVDFEQTAVTLKNLGKHPNVGAVLVVGLGCERFQSGELAEDIHHSGKWVGVVVIQESGGSQKAVERGLELAQIGVEKLSNMQRQSVSTSKDRKSVV
jgi:altronate dehydratase large subunit